VSPPPVRKADRTDSPGAAVGHHFLSPPATTRTSVMAAHHQAFTCREGYRPESMPTEFWLTATIVAS